MWYINKGLANITHKSDSNIEIQLLFEPAGRANTIEEEKYYTQLKQNCCVVCGNNTSFSRHYVVPREYRWNILYATYLVYIFRKILKIFVFI